MSDEKLEDFFKECSNIATVIKKEISTEDITGEYYDSESRLKSLEIQ